MGRSMDTVRNHERVYQVLEAARTPLSAYALLAALRGQGITAPLTVYRALERLVLEGRVHRLESLTAYVVCRHPSEHAGGSAVFAICRDCGIAEELVQPAAFARLREAGERHGFATDEASIELRGYCAACRERAEAHA
ncbi:transcriptional repressor [Aurantimonas endophytica]|uniref:Fur family zinc uptake transcriptional regulator n=1 Tax=Aurantimonas endophytica TaxID=1522175 RepID=A0A7W6HBP4_9HYPH|nr:transcriptional repressor [Aurantimonas endophytica]MBB4002229.1 Fur family zinc uptake transcriptional regulator [Aurantimonas endophytica]